MHTRNKPSDSTNPSVKDNRGHYHLFLKNSAFDSNIVCFKIVAVTLGERFPLIFKPHGDHSNKGNEKRRTTFKIC